MARWRLARRSHARGLAAAELARRRRRCRARDRPGRADLRPPTEDFVRLAGQDFDRDPDLEAAFLEGYGVDPRTPEQWRRDLLGQAVGTAVWAYGVRDAAFEEHGHALLGSLYGEGE